MFEQLRRKLPFLPTQAQQKEKKDAALRASIEHKLADYKPEKNKASFFGPSTVNPRHFESS